MIFATGALCLKHESCCPQSIICPGCNRKYESQSELSAHLAKPLRARPSCQAGACAGCGRACASSSECFKHEETCWSILLCPGCNGHFGSTDKYQAHLRSGVPGCSAVQCSVCGAVFSSREECDSHAQKHQQMQRSRRRRTGQAVSGIELATTDSFLALPAPPPGATVFQNSGQLVKEDSTAFLHGQALTSKQAPEDIIQDIAANIGGLSGDALRRRLRQLQLRWHPDQAWREGFDDAQASKIFVYVQTLWEACVNSSIP